MDDAYNMHAPVLFADHDMSPLSLAHLFTVTTLSFNEPALLKASHDGLVAR